MDKGRAAADDILIEAALTFVDAHGHTAGQAGEIVAVVGAQLIQGMAALVDHGEHAGHQIILVIVGGDADILVVEIGGVGMLRFRNTAVAPVDGQHLHEVIGEFPLDLDGIELIQEAVIDLPRRLDLLHQGYDGFPELGKEGIQSGGIQSLLVFVQQGIVGCHFRMVVTGELYVIGHDLLQIGCEGREIVLIFGLFPNILGIVQQNSIGHVFLRGDLVHLVIALAQNLHLPLAHGGQFLRVGLQEGQQLSVFRVGGQVIGDPGQDAHGSSPALPAILGGGGTGIVVQNTHHMAVGRHGFLEFIQRFQRLFYGFVFHSGSRSF